MKTTAIICEYNPFHNGHKYQLDIARLSCDAVICIMSGSFMQRGDIAVFDKWTRAKMALLSGCDLVLELPVISSLNTAERFAYGGCYLADSLGVVDTLLFGSECGDINKLVNASNILINEPVEISAKIKDNLANGMSYPNARAIAYNGLIDNDLLSEPNNILAIEYINALKKLNSKIVPKTIERNSVSHHDLNSKGKFASASAIREMIKNDCDFSNLVPKEVIHLYKNPVTKTTVNEVLRYKISDMALRDLSNINDVAEGLENRIKQAVCERESFDDIADYIKSKRYTLSRIRRILFSAIIGFDKSLAKESPSYIRVLGANQKGLSILSDIKKKSKLPIITKTADFKGLNKAFDLDIYATDVYNILQGKKTGEDYFTSPAILY